MSLLETLAGRGGGPQITLHYAVRNGSEHAFKPRITQLAGQLCRLNVTTWYSQPLVSDIVGRDFDKAGRISADDLLPLLPQRPRFYLCGPAAMMAELRAGLIARGVPPFEIFTKCFRSPVSKPVADGSARKVHFRRSGALLEWTSASGTILDLAEKSGVRVPTGCRFGQCESCAVALLEGSVDHIVAADEIAEGQCLTCQRFRQRMWCWTPEMRRIAMPVAHTGAIVSERLPFDTDAGIGARANFGLIVLRTDQTVEAEVRGLLPTEGVGFYCARIHSDVTGQCPRDPRA